MAAHEELLYNVVIKQEKLIFQHEVWVGNKSWKHVNQNIARLELMLDSF